MAFTAKDVVALREKTGVGMMDCKKALVETDGDIDKAIEVLREKRIPACLILFASIILSFISSTLINRFIPKNER